MGSYWNRVIAMKNNKQPSIDDLSVFLAVCKASGFRAAAKRLGLSPSNVSDTIKRVETQLGVSLFNRNTRSVMPTEAGRELEMRLSPLLAETYAVVDSVVNTEKKLQGVLKLNVTGAVMVDILPPLIDRFLLRHPSVKVELIVDDQLVDAIAEGCVAGIRYGEHLKQNMIAVPIGPRYQCLALAAAPSYLAKRKQPCHPLDLLHHDCVRMRFSSGALTAWEFEREGEVVIVDPPSRLIIGVDGASAAIDLACLGHGIICTFENWLNPYFQSGALEPVMQEWWQQFEGPRLYFSSRVMPAVLRAFIDLISESPSQ